MNIAVIGLGHWGPKLLRNFVQHKGCTVRLISDLNPDRLKLIKENYPHIESTTDYRDIINNPDIDAVVIATPTHTHYPIAKKALLNGKHVLVEKPISNSVKNAEDLIEIAEKKQKVLMVDHITLYTGAVQKIKSLVDEGVLGKINYFDAIRTSLGLFRHDVNVLWDLALHDISTLFFILNERPFSVQAQGFSNPQNPLESAAYMVLKYQSGLIAHLNSSWISQVKTRQLLIGGSKNILVYNDLLIKDKVKIYDSAVEIEKDAGEKKLSNNDQEPKFFIPELDDTEALFNLTHDFISAIVNKTNPISHWKLALEVVQLLEACDISLKEKGREVIL